jgi:hypothetical protein
MKVMDFEVVEIHPDCKYIIKVTGPTTLNALEEFRTILDRWLKSDEPILVAGDRIELVKVMDDEQSRQDAST